MAFREIFHEGLASLDLSNVACININSCNSKHPDAFPYFVEFTKLIGPSGGVQDYSAEMAFE